MVILFVCIWSGFCVVWIMFRVVIYEFVEDEDVNFVWDFLDEFGYFVELF